MVRNSSMTLFVVCGETRTELHGPVREVSSNSVAISRVIDEVLAAKRAANLRPSYLRNLRIYLRAFASGRESNGISTFTTAAIESWFTLRDEKPATRRANTGRLSSMFSFAFRRSYIRENPCLRLEKPRIDYKPPVVLTPLQCRTFLLYFCSTPKKKWRLAQFVLSLFCAIRPNETMRLYWKDVDLEKAIVRIDASASKVRRRRIVPIPENALAWLRLCEQDESRPIGSVRAKWMRVASARTGIKWHQDILRHSGASYLLAKFPNAGQVARWLGNSESILLRHYAELVSAEDCEAFWNITP